MRTRVPLIAIIFCFIAPVLLADASYTVKKGDTLYRIARLFGTSVSALAKANGLSESDTLLEGKKLLIPGGQAQASPAPSPKSTILLPSPAPSPSAPADAKKSLVEYRIRSGDTLYSIARAHGMEIDDLLSLNKLKLSSLIKTGAKLLVYQDPAAPSPPPSAAPLASPKPAPGADRPGPKASLSWPVEGRMEYLDGKLYGVSIVGRKGDPIRAVANGTVVQANTYRGYSGVIFIERADNMIYVYSGCEGILVKKGDRVQAGMKLGYLGLDPRSGDASMSFMVFQNGKALDPSRCPRD